MGRKLTPIDPKRVFKLARIGCPTEEIADILGTSRQTLDRRFRAELARARASLKMSIRRAQYLRAVKDRSDTMLVHLGKVLLGQLGADDGGELGGVLAAILADAGRDGALAGDPGAVPE